MAGGRNNGVVGVSGALAFARLLYAMLPLSVHGFTPSGDRVTTFATFGNMQTKELIKAWKPRPLAVSEGSCLLPSQESNLQRYVRARILLEDANTGCVASFGDKLCIILCRFSRAEHQLVLPLWHPDQQPSNTLKELIDWHTSAFASNKGARLSGDALEWKEDKEMWLKLIANGEAGI